MFNKKKNSSRTSGSVIPEENLDEYWTGSEGSNSNHEKYPSSVINSTTSAVPQQTFGSVGSSSSMSLQQSQTGVSGPKSIADAIRRGSPAPMYSPCGSSPAGDHVGTTGYMMMSPGIEFSRKWVLKFKLIQRYFING